MVLLRRPSWRRAVRKGVAAAVEHRNVPFGHDFATVVDVGAHHGQFALLALELFPRSRILCVEPLPDGLQRLRATVEPSGRVTVLAAAEAGNRELHVSRKTDSSSLLPILKVHVDAFPGTEEACTLEVEAKTLDSMVAERIQRSAC
jgi:FkbM family methyltransferase